MTTKQELRARIRQQKRQHTYQQLQAYSQSIARSLLDRIAHIQQELCATDTDPTVAHRSLTILLYHSLPDEVDTHDLIRRLYALGHTVLLPTICGDTLQLHRYEGDTSLTASASFGIQESQGPLFTDFSSIDLAIIPGIAFTSQGDRLGRGKGYYDRLLPLLCCPLIGLAFPFQMLPSIPTEPHDIQMTTVLTL